MGKKLSPVEAEIYRRVDEVIHYVWDPIGVSGAAEARDEYYSYLPQIYSMLIEEKDNKRELVEHLLSIQWDRLGMGVDSKSELKAAQVVELLYTYKTLIIETSSWRK